MLAADVIRVDAVRAKLRRGGVLSSRSLRRLQAELAARERIMDALSRVGLGAHAAENIYSKPNAVEEG